MAMLYQQHQDGIQLGKELDKCFMCEREARKEGRTLKTGELTNKEVFLLHFNGLRQCLCMSCFASLLGEYTLVQGVEDMFTEDEILELDAETLENATTVEEVKDHIEEQIEVKANAKAAKTAKSSKGK